MVSEEAQISQRRLVAELVRGLQRPAKAIHHFVKQQNKVKRITRLYI